MDHDDTGKASFDEIYVADDPRPYFRTLRTFGYEIPAAAQPHFARLVARFAAVRGVEVPTVLDVGCSYGVNAALLRTAATLTELYERYGEVAGDTSREALVASDRALVRDRPSGVTVRVVGLDTSAPALRYAVDAGFLDDGVEADLESGEPTDDQRDRLRHVGLVVSTGCVGYVTEKTLLRVVDAVDGPRPWMAHFVLRMFPFDTIAGQLDDLGYETTTVGGSFRQRRFVSPRERDLVLARLAELGIAEDGEAGGRLYARLHVSVPKGER